MAKGAGPLRERVAFDRKATTPDGYGGESVSWSELFACAAEFRYQRGSERVEAGGLTGQASFKVRVRANDTTRGLTAEDRMRDVRRSETYNIVEPPDAITDRAHVWLVVTSGVAV